MRTVGVIAEYNPFHTGHARQLAELRRRFGADTAIVCAMSGNFVQRGDFAILRKHARAAAAVQGGADLVLELPLPWAISSAEGFARGGVEALDAAGAEILAFGSECADTDKLLRAADALLDARFPDALRRELKRGDSFAHARRRAAEALCGADAAALDSPNDILGVEYCKALRTLGSNMEPLALPRFGAAHDGAAAEGFASASELRARLLDGRDADAYLTPAMRRVYERERAAGRAPVCLRNAERAVLARLRALDEEAYARCDGGGEGLYRRLYAASREAAGFEELLDAAKTKRVARARLRRMALALYLGVDAPPARVPYLRVLAMNGRGRLLLHALRGSAKLPLLIKPADVRELSAQARRLMETEARATDLYALAYPDLAQSGGGSEWRTGPVIVEEKTEDTE